jgi:uncharacterized protein
MMAAFLSTATTFMTTETLAASTVAQYLIDNPQFFEVHAGLLGEVKLSSPLTGRAVSLQERQMEVMREKYRVLELRLADLTRRAEENHAIANRFHAWNQALLGSDGGAAMAQDLTDALRTEFMVPQVTLRLWDLAPEHAGAWFASDVSSDVRLFASGLRAPYCGLNNDFEAVRWLADPAAVRSTVLMPLSIEGKTFGLLVLGAPDVERFTSTMATDFLAHIAATASTALAPLRG